MNTPDMEGIREFAESSDRDTARFFVGRLEVLDNINHAWQSRMKGWKQGRKKAFSSATRVVQGAPGAGKTSLGVHLEDVWGYKGESRTPLSITLNPKTLNNPLAVFMTICEKIKPKALTKITNIQTVQKTTGVGVDKIVKAEHQHQTTLQERTAPPAEWLELRLALGKYDWQRPICLLIDEAQTLDQPGIDLLASMHQGTHQLPIFPLLLGLGSTRTVLFKGGITRPESGSVHTLPSLTREEVEELCSRYFKVFGIRGSEQEKRTVTDRLYAWSDGWPSHMHNALKGLSHELLHGRADLGKVNMEQSLEKARVYRQEYYSDRLGDLFRTSEIFLGQFMAAIPASSPIMGKDILPLIIKAQKEAIRLGNQEIAKHSAVSVFDRLMHQGFIQPAPGNNYVCPIPSLRRWCIKQAGMEDPQKTAETEPESKPDPSQPSPKLGM